MVKIKNLYNFSNYTITNRNNKIILTVDVMVHSVIIERYFYLNPPLTLTNSFPLYDYFRNNQKRFGNNELIS